MKIQQTVRTLLRSLLWALPLCLRAQTAGVGINTENLQGVFQVDAAINNPPSGTTFLPREQADDLVITPEGKVGIGTLAPSTRLHIHTRQTGAVPLRIADGSHQGNSKKLLVSDDSGVASWQSLPPAPTSSTVYPIQTVSLVQTFAKGTVTQAGNSEFSVPEDGFYSMDVRFWMATTSNTYSNPPIRTVTRFQLRRYREGTYTIVDEYQYNEPSYVRITAFMTLYASALQGDELSLWIYPVEGFSVITPATSYEWTKTKILYKKLEINDGTHYFD
jgi:hypothetical protein